LKYAHLVWASLFRRPTRTVLTLVSIVAAFLLFGLLDAVRTAFGEAGQSADGAARLQTSSKLSFIQPLPQSLAARIAGVEGVRDVTWANWFGGAYQDPRNRVFSFAVAPNYLELYPEISVTGAERRAFDAAPRGALAGAELAGRYRWKVGDRVPLQSTIYPDRAGSKDWPFDVVGILHAADRKTGGFYDQMFLLHWKTFDETTPYNRGQVGWYVTRVADVREADRIAREIDALSANSDHETRTQSEQAATASWLKQLADIGLIVGSIMGAVFFTLLLLAGNTMMQAVRERTAELAVLKTIGFTGPSVLAMVLAESMLLLLLGGTGGLALATVVVPAVGAASGGVLNLPAVGASSWALGYALMLAIGAFVGALPAWHALRLTIVDALAGR
jgi:putative ABC transport system permease protein